MPLAEVTWPPWDKRPPRCPTCKLALTEAPLCRGVEPRCSGAEVTGGTLTAPSLFSGTDGGVRRGEMTASHAPTQLAGHPVLLQNKEAPARACCTWEPGGHCGQVKGKPTSLGPPRRCQHIPSSGHQHPAGPCRISLHHRCAGGWLSGRAPPALCFPNHNTSSSPKTHVRGIAFLPPLCTLCTYYCPY